MFFQNYLFCWGYDFLDSKIFNFLNLKSYIISNIKIQYGSETKYIELTCNCFFFLNFSNISRKFGQLLGLISFSNWYSLTFLENFVLSIKQHKDVIYFYSLYTDAFKTRINLNNFYLHSSRGPLLDFFFGQYWHVKYFLCLDISFKSGQILINNNYCTLLGLPFIFFENKYEE
jgi:hypothetical protein